MIMVSLLSAGKATLAHAAGTQAPLAQACSSQPLGLASNYNMFIFGNATGLHDSLGNVAIGGNANFTNAGVGITGNLIVGGNLSATSGQVGGSLTVGGQNNAGGSFNALGGVNSGSPINFAAEKARLQQQSATYAGYPATGSTNSSYGTVTMSGNQPGLNVFTIDASMLGSANGININVPSGATVLINVTGSNVTMQNFQISVNGTSRNNVMWNMPNASSLTMSGISIQGSILAPNAAVNFSNGNFEGTLVANSWTGNGEGHNYLFTGCVPPVSPPTPVAPTATRPAPTATVIAPTATRPAPTATRPAPTATVIAPTATRPAPTATRPAPTATRPAPTATVVVPTATRPAPTATRPAPTATRPAPTATVVVPTATRPAPTATRPAPTATPIPPTATPAPTAPPPALPTCAYSVQVVPGPDVVRGNPITAGIGCPVLEQVFATPKNVVLREPFPRSLVAEDTRFVLEPAPSPNYLWSAPRSPTTTAMYINALGLPTRSGVTRNYQIGTMLRRLNGGTVWPAVGAPRADTVISTTWRFQDRNWNNNRPHPQLQLGDTPRWFHYQTSSFGLPERGRAFDFSTNRPSNALNLPSYDLEVVTPWGYQYNMRWQESQRTNCSAANMIDAVTPRAGYTIDGCPPGQAALPTEPFQWVDRSLASVPINLNLRDYPGFSMSYRQLNRVEGCGEFAGVRYCDPEGDRVFVPVIEVQTILRSN
jgi:choice-of-anchor A domain-containing protein